MPTVANEPSQKAVVRFQALDKEEVHNVWSCSNEYPAKLIANARKSHDDDKSHIYSTPDGICDFGVPNIRCRLSCPGDE